MKKLVLAAVVTAALGLSHTAVAADQMLSLGYSHSKIEDFDKINGVNIKYRFEWDKPVGIIASFSYMSGDSGVNQSFSNATITGSADVKYYSFTVGPAWRINDYVSLYGLLGVNVHEVDYSGIWDFGYVRYRVEQNETNAAAAYGVGLQFNPTKNLAIDVAYEGSRLSFDDENYSTNGFNIGVGYRF